MAFGDFAARMGDVAVGMEDMAGKMQRRQLDAQRAEANASTIRGQQREENDAQRLAELNRRMLASMPQGNAQQGFDVQSHGANAPVMAQSGEIPQVAKGPAVAGAPAPQDYAADVAIYQKQYDDATGRLAALQASDSKYKQGQRALVSGAAKPLAAAADVLTSPYNLGGMLLEKGVNAAGYVANSVAGKQVVRDDYDTFEKRGATPYYDAHVRAAGRENPETSPEMLDLQQQQTGYKEGLNRFKKLQAQSDAAARSPVAGPNADAERISSIMSMFPKASPAVTPELISAIKGIENRSGNPNAVSPKGAFGVMQTMPGTFNDMSKMYFDGKLDPKNAQHQEMAGVAYLNHLATVELPRLGIPPTPENIASAYQQGPSGLKKNGISAGVSDGITNNAQYTQKVMAGMGGAQPQAAAPADHRGILQAPQQAAPQAQGQFQTVGGTNYDPSADQRAFMQNYLTQVVQTSRNPQVQQQAMQQLMGLRIDDANAKVTSIGHAATMGNPQAMQQLVSMYAGPGNRIGVAKLSDGQIGLVTAQGQVVEAFRDEATLANALVVKLNTSLQQQKAAIGVKAAEAGAIEGAKAGAKAPYEQAMELIKRDATLNAEYIKGDAKVRQELVKQVAEAQQFGRSINLGDGSAVAISNDGTRSVVISPGTPDPKNRNIMGGPTSRMVTTPGLQVPAGRG